MPDSGRDIGNSLYEYTIVVPREFSDADRRLFVNPLGFNNLQLRLLNSLPDRFTGEFDETLYLTGVTDYGIVISVDTVGDLNSTPLAGFHNCLVPWSQIASMYQYIAT